MTVTLGVAIAGGGNIAGRYAADSERQPHVRLVGATDLDLGFERMPAPAWADDLPMP